MPTTRELSAKRALELLGKDRFTSFIRFIQNDSDCYAVRLMSEELSRGTDVSRIFFTGERYGYNLSVTLIEKNLYHIKFGYQAGPLAGDGGEWKVRYNPNGSISQVDPGVTWIS